MAKYTTADIKALREKTGAGMLDVKKALEEADGDAEKAIEIIRVKGLKGIAKREGRSATAGLIAAKVVEATDGTGGQVGVLVEVNAETDFVAKNQKFIDFAAKVLDAAVDSGAETVEELAGVATGGSTVKELTDSMQAVIGEKIVVRRVGRLAAPRVETYLHRTNPDLPAQVAVLVGTDEAAAEVAHDVAMHVAAYSPLYLTREDVPAETIAKERAIAEETTRAEGKPEKAVPRIVEGRLNGYFKENCLVDQPYAKDPKTTVGKVVKATGGSLTGFVRFRVGA
ncbi:translation elongation factor Ts [Actinomyces israelii]|uniref:Elongation factor Ts n=1 Tax=Actinomyces israelii TaxID=1659 RepID=A0ABT4ICS1_9ACTO|nr:translation elongation factor Ts [Actinomyces israelii]MCZ0859541.1 translation elongation factor Ts [Actinomyces israelii]WKR22180.1 Elongation factor Ts [Actinomyces israelii]